MKDRVTLTLDRTLIRRIDASIDGTLVKNRSHAIEMLLYKALTGDMPQQGVIICGGPTETLDKMLDLKSGKSLLQRNVEHLSESGIPEIIVVSGDPNRVKDHLKEVGDEEIEIHYVAESTPLGNAGALNLARPYLHGPTVVTYGSAYKEVSIKDMYDFHVDHAGLCTIALTTVSDPSKYGVALLNGSRIITFVEKPDADAAPSNLISAGFFIIEPEVLDLLPDGYAKLEYDILPKLAKDDKLHGFNFPGTYLDVSK